MLSDVFGAVFGWRRTCLSGVDDLIVSDLSDAVRVGYQSQLVQFLGGANLVCQA